MSIMSIALMGLMMWNNKAIKKEIMSLLDEVEYLEGNEPKDNSGNQVPASLAIMFILKQLHGGDFHGSIGLKIKGRKVLTPEISNQTFRFMDKYKNYHL